MKRNYILKEIEEVALQSTDKESMNIMLGLISDLLETFRSDYEDMQ